MGYTIFDVDRILRNMVVVYDTREQNTPALRRRLKDFNRSRRLKLDYGDYTAGYEDLDGTFVTLKDKVVIERKMSLDELCACFTSGRDRFQREFERAKADKAKIHMVVENGSYEKMFSGSYHSKFHPNAFIASYLAWSARYNIQLHFCKPETTGKLIYKILYYELKEVLEAGAGI